MRLEAVRAASFFTVPEAVEVVFIAQDKPADQYVNHVIGETMKALDPIVQEGHRGEAADQVHHAGRRPVLPQVGRHR